MNAGTAWVVAGMVLLIAEIFVPGFAVAAFGLACLAAGASAFLGWGTNAQLLTFAATTAFVFLTIRPVVLRYLDAHGGRVRTNVGGLIGKTGVVSQRIDPASHTGRVVVEGDDWRAIPVDEEPLETGRQVQVVGVEGTKLFVRPL